MAAEEHSAEPTGAVLGPGSRPAGADLTAAREAFAIYDEFDRQDAADRNRAEVVLREALGNDFIPGRRLANRYLDGLPVAEREKIESKVLPSGVLALNDPKFVLELGVKALGPMPRTEKENDALIEASEGRMKNDREKWFRDEAAQLRYRMSLAARDRINARKAK
jgi:hypothetical protein